MADTVLKLSGVTKQYGEKHTVLEVLRGVDLTVAAGESVALVGPSGCGKSTLLQVAGLLDNCDGGELALCGESVAKANDGARTALRREKLGFVYQFHHLLPEFTALENVLMPLQLQGKVDEAAAIAMLERVGLSARMTHRPSELSGGEKQRVAIARALVHKPALLIADEPTGNLDPALADEIFALIKELVKEAGLSALIATHNHALAKQLNKVVTLEEGKIVELPHG